MKFEFINELRKINSKCQSMTKDERRQFEQDRYQAIKTIREGVEQTDGSVVYYVINSNWIEQWKSFINDNGDMPGEIDNSQLK